LLLQKLKKEKEIVIEFSENKNNMVILDKKTQKKLVIKEINLLHLQMKMNNWTQVKNYS
jgi:hypothetical protein